MEHFVYACIYMYLCNAVMLFFSFMLCTCNTGNYDNTFINNIIALVRSMKQQSSHCYRESWSTYMYMKMSYSTTDTSVDAQCTKMLNMKLLASRNHERQAEKLTIPHLGSNKGQVSLYHIYKCTMGSLLWNLKLIMFAITPTMPVPYVLLSMIVVSGVGHCYTCMLPPLPVLWCSSLEGRRRKSSGDWTVCSPPGCYLPILFQCIVVIDHNCHRHEFTAFHDQWYGDLQCIQSTSLHHITVLYSTCVRVRPVLLFTVVITVTHIKYHY